MDKLAKSKQLNEPTKNYLKKFKKYMHILILLSVFRNINLTIIAYCIEGLDWQQFLLWLMKIEGYDEKEGECLEFSYLVVGHDIWYNVVLIFGSLIIIQKVLLPY